MRKLCITLMLGLLSTGAMASSAEPTSGGGAPHAPAVAPRYANLSGTSVSGKVVETMDAGRYTYIHVDSGGTRLWAAGPQTVVKVGDTVSLSGGTPMVNFYSKHLDRTFDELLLVGAIDLASGAPAGAARPAASPSGAAAPAAAAVTGIAPAEGGATIAEVLTQRTALTGKQIAVRGQVVKVNSRILGKNWIHLEDGTAGPGGTKNLVVTTDDTASVGSVVLVRGTVATDKDFGAGYSYEVLIEDASVETE